MEASKGTNPPPGDVIDPKGYARDFRQIDNPKRNKIIPQM
jgi:hypothetical protein